MSPLEQQDAERVKARNAWRAVCAKVGAPAAAEASNGSGLELQQCHEERKKVRQALNKITEAVGTRQVTEEEHLAYAHGGALVASLSNWIDNLEGWQNQSRAVKGMKVLRSQADFERHYKTNSIVGEEFGIADFLRGVANMPTIPEVKNALSVGTDTSGGYGVPSLVMPQILGALAPASSLMQAGMGVVPLEDGAKSYTTAAIDTIPTAAWRAENGDVVESDPAFRGVVAAPKSLAFLFKVSRELLADCENLQPALLQAIGQAFAKELDRTGLRGSGVAPQPTGLLNTAGINTVTNGANGAALAGYANLFSAVQEQLEADAPMPTAAIMSPRSLVKLGGLVDTAGQPLQIPTMLSEVKQLSTSQIPNDLEVGSSTDCSEIYVGDFTKMVLMLRENVSVQLVSELFAGKGQVGFVCHVRADFAVLYPKAFTLVTGVR